MAAWQVRPPRLVTMAAAVFITGSQSGVVVSATSTSPGWKDESWCASVTTRTRPVAMRGADGAAGGEHRPLPFQREGFHFQRAAARGDGLRPRLDDVEVAVQAVLGPLDVHRPRAAGTVVVLDPDRVFGEPQHIVVGQAEALPVGSGVGTLRVGSRVRPGRVDHLHLLLAEPRRSTARWPCRKVGLWT